MEQLMPLKQKYRVYRSFNNGMYKSRAGNSHPPLVKHPGGIRKRAYGPIWSAPPAQKGK